MHGVILSFMLTYSIFNPSWAPSVPVSAEIAGGYHYGPLYAKVILLTHMEQVMFGFAYKPLSINYDFRFGARWKGFDVSISRFCQHDIFGSSYYPSDGGVQIIARWSNWPKE